MHVSYNAVFLLSIKLKELLALNFRGLESITVMRAASRLVRISVIVVAKTSFTKPPQNKIENLFEHSFGIFIEDDEPQKVVFFDFSGQLP